MNQSIIYTSQTIEREYIKDLIIRGFYEKDNKKNGFKYYLKNILDNSGKINTRKKNIKIRGIVYTEDRYFIENILVKYDIGSKKLVGSGKDKNGNFTVNGNFYYCNIDKENGFKYLYLKKNYLIGKSDTKKFDLLIKYAEQERNLNFDLLIKYAEEERKLSKKRDLDMISNEKIKKRKINQPERGSLVEVFDKNTDQFWPWLVLRKTKEKNYEMKCLYPLGFKNDNWYGYNQNIKLENYYKSKFEKKNKYLNNGDWFYQDILSKPLNEKELGLVLRRIDEKRKGDYIFKIIKNLFPKKIK